MSYKLERIPEVALALSGFDRVCAITVALKITDDSCKMDAYEKSIFMRLYDAMPKKESTFFDGDVFDIISQGRTQASAQTFAKIKALRESAMDFISRPKMKAFKAQIRVDIGHD